MNTPHAPDQQHYSATYWWIVLVVTGALSLTFNLWMVIDPPDNVTAGQATTNLVLGIIVHAAPVILSGIVSHGFKTPLLGAPERAVIIVLFLAFMFMSISHQASLLEHGVHLEPVWAWVLPAAIDTIALLSLRAILNAARLNKQADIARDVAAERAAVAADIRPEVEQDIRREYDAKLPALREDIRREVVGDIWRRIAADTPVLEGGDIDDDPEVLVEVIRQATREEVARDMSARWEIEREDLADQIRQEEREAAMARQEEREEALRRQIEVQVRRELAAGGGAGRRRAISDGRTSAKVSAKVSADEGKAMVAEAIKNDPDITNVELAEMLGVTTKTISRWKGQMGLSRSSGSDDDGEVAYGDLRAV